MICGAALQPHISKVNEARKHLFAYGNRQLENIPPTAAQHVKRAVYQGGHVWGQALVASPNLPSPALWGWKADDAGDWNPVWSYLPEAGEACRELVKCNCRKGCSGRCKCRKSALRCTHLCACAAQCGLDE